MAKRSSDSFAIAAAESKPEFEPIPTVICRLLVQLEISEGSKFVDLSFEKQPKIARARNISHSKSDRSVMSAEEVEKQQIVTGVRQANEITVETFDLTDVRQRNHSQASTSANIHEGSNEKDVGGVTSRKFYTGNPFVEKTEGILHFYKENVLQELATSFYSQYNGTQFNMLEEHVCHLVYVAKVESLGESEGAGDPKEGHTELPTCPVCLERMDESVDGILTILCNHSFHSVCLSKWGDTSCPVCRFCQTPELTDEHKCFVCNRQEDLWICLICGHIGCGRYADAHAQAHFKETSHTYSLQVGGQRVWDYAGDNYVHRLILSKNDGKPVQFDGPQEENSQEKLDAVTLEYTYLLTSQLESQRAYFEEKIDYIEKEANTQVDTFLSRLSEATSGLEEKEASAQKLVTEKTTLEKKVQQTNSKLQKVTNKIKEAEDMNKILLQDQVKWTEKVKQLEIELKKTQQTKDTEIKELNEQIRDIMFHLEAESKIKEQGEIKGGDVSVPQSSPKKTSKRK